METQEDSVLSGAFFFFFFFFFWELAQTGQGVKRIIFLGVNGEALMPCWTNFNTSGLQHSLG
jgi:hypothetical protein